MVNHPPHYTRGPAIHIGTSWFTDKPRPIHRVLECIEVIRHVKDMRLANALKYTWRVAFGGKENDREDIKKAIWYLNDWLEHRIDAEAVD